MTAPEFDPALVEQAAEAGCRAAHSTRWEYRATSHVCDDCARITLAVLTAVAPTLRADGAAANEARWLEGVERAESAYQRGMVAGARLVLAKVEARWGEGQAEMLAAAREAVTRIADGAPS